MKKIIQFIQRCVIAVCNIAMELCRRIVFALDKSNGAKHITIDPRELFACQDNRRYNRLDVAVRYLAVEQHYGKNAFGYDLYKKMQQAQNVEWVQQSGEGNHASPEEKLKNFIALIESWEKNGYDPKSEILCLPNLQLLDGSHRLSLALYHQTPKVSVARPPRQREVEYGPRRLFGYGFSLDEVRLVMNKYDELQQAAREPFSCILWPPVARYFDEITEKLDFLYGVESYKDHSFPAAEFPQAVRAVYHIDDIEAWKIERKIEGMCQPGTGGTVRVITLNVALPNFRLKAKNNQTLSVAGEQIKKMVRECYKGKVENYFYDIIIHTGDNYRQNRYLLSIFEPPFDWAAALARLEPCRWEPAGEGEPVSAGAENPAEFPLFRSVTLRCEPAGFEVAAAEMLGYIRENCAPRCAVETTEAAGRVQIEITQDKYPLLSLTLCAGGQEPAPATAGA